MTEYYVYLLGCSDGSTYVGATVDIHHRLRQHNGEIKRRSACDDDESKTWIYLGKITIRLRISGLVVGTPI